MELLVLGGTQFVGRHLVEAALARGWRVTLFNRGQTNAELFPEAEKLRGDRDPQINPGLSALQGHHWDVVVDCNGYVPRLARAAAEALRDAVGQYIFISTGSVYDFNQLQGEDDESAPPSSPSKTRRRKNGSARLMAASKCSAKRRSPKSMASAASPCGWASLPAPMTPLTA